LKTAQDLFFQDGDVIKITAVIFRTPKSLRLFACSAVEPFSIHKNAAAFLEHKNQRFLLFRRLVSYEERNTQKIFDFLVPKSCICLAISSSTTATYAKRFLT
jgi:hypothetical protein